VSDVRPSWRVLFLLVALLGAAACRGRAPRAGANREPAYRANNIGVAHLEQFQYDEAAAAFRQALALDSSLAIARVNLGIALYYAQDLDGAAREETAGARSLGSVPQAPYILGLIARAQNRESDAVSFFQRVLQIDPHDVGAEVNLAQLRLETRQYAEAIPLLRSAVADEPYNVTAAYTLGLALTRAGQAEEGQRRLQQSQDLRKAGYATLYGNQYLEQGRYAEAIASTGSEPDLVDAATPPAHWTAAPGSRSAPPRGESSPFGQRFDRNALTASGMRAIAASLGGAVTLIDFDRDGNLDVFVSASGVQRLLRNDGRGSFTDVTASSGLGNIPADSVPVGAVAGDYDNDGLPDLFVLRYGRSSLYHNDGNGKFSDVTSRAGIAEFPYLPGAAAFVDVDHDGDLDLVVAGLADLDATRRQATASLVFPAQFAPAPVRLWRNNGNGTFTDTTKDAGLASPGHAIGIVPTDFDDRRDIDLLIVNSDTAPVLFKNLRDGSFRDVAADVGLAGVVSGNDTITTVATADINKDDFPDFYFGGSRGGVFAMSDAKGRFTLVPAPEATPAAAARFVDYDNDGLPDLLTWTARGPRLLRNLGMPPNGSAAGRWANVTTNAFPGSATEGVTAGQLGAADLDGDGTTDLLTMSGGDVVYWRNSGDPRHHSLRVALAGRVSNRQGIGSKVQLRAGSLRERLETSAATPAVAPADVVFGIGDRATTDVVRVLWPSGVLQAEVSSLASPLTVQELNRKPSSCPFLFAWSGTRFEFVTDFMGGGEMGSWERPGEWNRPSPVEYVRIRSDQLRPQDGRYEFRVTHELEETLYADRFQLIAVSHPSDVDVFPNEGLTDPPKPFRLFAVQDEHVPTRVVDEHGHDVTSKIARLDRQYPDDFALAPFRGFARKHSLTIDLAPPGEKHPSGTMLLLTGWTEYAFSSDNVAARQAGLELEQPSVDVKGADGRWRPVIQDIGMPVGRPQTIVVDLGPLLRPGEHEVRITTNLRIFWDQILAARPADLTRTTVARIDPERANLRERGFSAEVHPDGREPATYDYDRVATVSDWKAMPGRYTRTGDVRSLLSASDDMFVIAKPGDEIALSFDAARAGVLPPGWTRTFLLLADGFSKEMDINSGSPDTVEPLPFHRMTRYPYVSPERYPETPSQSRYLERDNTRAITRALPSLDHWLAK
jgi:Flp pilus assembly protein TadD